MSMEVLYNKVTVVALEIMCQNNTILMFICEQPLAELVSCIATFEYSFVSGFILNNTQIWLLVTIFLATFKVKKVQLIVT